MDYLETLTEKVGTTINRAGQEAEEIRTWVRIKQQWWDYPEAIGALRDLLDASEGPSNTAIQHFLVCVGYYERKLGDWHSVRYMSRY
jgi:hypothetical protein